VALRLEPGATIVAAEPAATGEGYDPPEPNARGGAYVDFGHGHLHNSLIWGENLENVSITGPGRIFGRGLSKGKDSRVRDLLPEERIAGKADIARREAGAEARAATQRNPNEIMADGVGNKAIALWNCRDVLLRDFSIYHGGHFAINVKGIDGLTIDNLKIDTNRDGIDVDLSRNVRISNCIVNSPYDDAIVLKSSFALGKTRPTENVTIVNCQVSGYDEGTLLDGRLGRAMMSGRNPPRFGPCGRIKLGTESNGGFRNITVTNCTFDYCRGLALEMVDGGIMEDVSVTNLVMRDIVNSPIYVRLGNRGRGPAGEGGRKVAEGAARRIRISQIAIQSPDNAAGILIDGLEGHAIEDLVLSDIRIDYKGGGTREEADRVVAELPREYPEPARWGILPAWGLWARHVRNLELRHVSLRTLAPDLRPAIALEDVAGAELEAVRTDGRSPASMMVSKNVSGLVMQRPPSSTP
jgi:polygalacturonase